MRRPCPTEGVLAPKTNIRMYVKYYFKFRVSEQCTSNVLYQCKPINDFQSFGDKNEGNISQTKMIVNLPLLVLNTEGKTLHKCNEPNDNKMKNLYSYIFCCFMERIDVKM
jgi:hypothetical protein